MLDGRDGKARQKAMELLVRYAEALGRRRGSSIPTTWLGCRARPIPSCRTTTRTARTASTRSFRTSISTPTSSSTSRRRSCRPSICRVAPIPTSWETLGVKPEIFRNYQEREALRREHGVNILKTCTPYLAGNVPAKGEHCAWMESSAVDLLQLGTGCADQHRRTREHERRDADREDSRLGSPPDGASIRHASHRRRCAGRAR